MPDMTTSSQQSSVSAADVSSHVPDSCAAAGSAATIKQNQTGKNLAMFHILN